MVRVPEGHMLSDSMELTVLPPSPHQVWAVRAEQVLRFLVGKMAPGECMCHFFRAGAELVPSQDIRGGEAGTEGKSQTDAVLGGSAGKWE